MTWINHRSSLPSSDLYLVSRTFTARNETAVSWSQRVPWIVIRQTCGIFLILVHPFFNFIYVSLPRRRSPFFRVLWPGSQSPFNPRQRFSQELLQSSAICFCLPLFASPRSVASWNISRLADLLLLLAPLRSPAGHSHSRNQNQSQAERSDEHDHLNDLLSTWSDYNTSASSSSMPVLAPRSPISSVELQSVFLGDEDPRLQYSFPAPQQVPRLYQPPRSHPSTPYSNHPTTFSPTNVSVNHPQNEIWQQNPYGGIPATDRLPEVMFSPVVSYSQPSSQYPTQRPLQGMPPDPHSSVPTNTSTTPSAGNLQRDPVSVERTATRSFAHTTTSPYPYHPPPKQRRKRENPEQVRVLDGVYARTTTPSIKQQQELAVKLDMTLEEVQIWYISFFTVSIMHLMSPLGLKTNDC